MRLNTHRVACLGIDLLISSWRKRFNSRRRNGLKAESFYREMLEAGRSVKLQITVRIAREDSLVLR
jgi:hypothetical protein